VHVMLSKALRVGDAMRRGHLVMDPILAVDRRHATIPGRTAWARHETRSDTSSTSRKPPTGSVRSGARVRAGAVDEWA
jgi:hypothetical protein